MTTLEEGKKISEALRSGDRNVGSAIGLLFGLLASACLAWQLHRFDAVAFFLVGGGLIGIVCGGWLGWRHFHNRQTSHSSDLATTIATVFALVPAAFQVITNLDEADDKAGILAVVGVAFVIVMVALFIGGALDRMYESALRKRETRERTSA